MLQSLMVVHKSIQELWSSKLFRSAGVIALLLLFMTSSSMQAADEKKVVHKRTNSYMVAAGGLVWQLDIDQAVRMAKKARKLVLVDVYTEWCGWCHKLDRDTYSKPAVIQYLNNQFVCLKIDAEDAGPGQAWAKQNQVNAFPCIAVLDDTGVLRGKFYGYRNADEFQTTVNELLSPMENPSASKP